VVTNIDREHLDYYLSLDAIKQVFLDFIDNIPFYGLAILCLDNEPLQELIPEIKKRFTTYGMTTQADLQARNVTFQGLTSKFDLFHFGKEMGEVTLNLPGLHNIYNAMAAVAVGIELNIAFPTIKSALETLEGVQRRMEVKGSVEGITIVDDYGHHPTEIKTTLKAVKESWPDRRIVVVFQPHRYTRTEALFDEFTRGFYESDLLLVLPIYSAGEPAIDGIDGRRLCDGIKDHGHKEVIYTDGIESAVAHLKRILKAGDLVLTLGAGDVWKVGAALLEKK
jgi:UDP-N-acetylmuramate--alanine ligase